MSLIAELGDLHRFRTANKLNAFVGIDLRFNDSGDYKAQVLSPKGEIAPHAKFYLEQYQI